MYYQKVMVRKAYWSSTLSLPDKLRGWWSFWLIENGNFKPLCCFFNAGPKGAISDCSWVISCTRPYQSTWGGCAEAFKQCKNQLQAHIHFYFFHLILLYSIAFFSLLLCYYMYHPKGRRKFLYIHFWSTHLVAGEVFSAKILLCSLSMCDTLLDCYSSVRESDQILF